MKKILILIASFAFALSSFADGIEFFHGTYNEAIEKAKAEGKLVFIDCYTSWCGPCKMLQKNVFPDAEVGKYFNDNFISIKLDCEKEEGVDLCRRFSVTAYPTLLFLDGNQKVVYRTLGLKTPSGLIDDGKRAQGSNDNVLNKLKEKYDGGDRSENVLYDYAFNLSKANKNYDTVFREYLILQKPENILQDKSAKLIFDLTNSLRSPGIRYLKEYAKYFHEKYGDESYHRKIEQIFNRSVKDAANTNNSALFTEAVSFAKSSDLPGASEKILQQSMMYYLAVKDVKNYDKSASTYLKKYKSIDARSLNDIAWKYYENIDNMGMLKKALKWSQMSTKLEDKYYNNITEAYLYRKLGMNADALAHAQYSLNKGKEENVNYWPAQDLINKIEIDRANNK